MWFIEKLKSAPILELSASAMFLCASVLCVVLIVKLVML